MKITTEIRYNHKNSFYCIGAKDNATNSIITIPREYKSEEEAELALSILKYMFFNYKSRAEFDLGLFDFKVKAVFHLLNGKWE